MKSRPIERNMFYGASRNIFLKAVDLRRNMTFAEKLLWKELSNRRIFKVRFKRQHPVDIFIVDFYCHKSKLAIEIDGEIHLKEEVRDYDSGRTFDLEKLGIKILRFTNNEVIENIENVKKKIINEINIISPL
jgi:very-short-patch-repair endonuclease